MLGAAFSDRLTNQTQVQSGAVDFTGETDRVYESKESTRIVDEAWGRTIQVEKVGSSQTVVWNPWIEKAAGMSDFGPKDGWKNMICVEAGSVKGWQTLEPGDAFEGAQTISAL